MEAAPVLVWSPELCEQHFGPGHPMDPVRLELTHALVVALGIERHLRVVPAPPATDEQLRIFHDTDYIAAVHQAQATGHAPAGFGLGDPDNPIHPVIHDASARFVGSTLAAVDAVVSGRAPRAFSMAGGMHHAMPGAAAGFCVYNDAAIAILTARAGGTGPVVYVDLDVHHGDGVQLAFLEDPNVTTISLQQHPRAIFPHTGYPAETGRGAGAGHALNVALPEEATDAGWLRAVEAVVEPVLREVRPALLVSQHGADTHARDPLGGLCISVEAQREACLMMRDLADRYCGGRWVALGGGGYDVAHAVPLVWTHVAAVVAGVDLDPATETPAAWRRQVLERTGQQAPLHLGDGVEVSWKHFSAGHDPADPVDRAIMATRRAAFPQLGLDPRTA